MNERIGGVYVAPDKAAAVYALANLHATHKHFGNDLRADVDWIPGAVRCDAAAAQVDAEATYRENIRATYALAILAA